MEEFTKQFQEASLRLLGKEASAGLAEVDYGAYKALVELTGGEGDVQFFVNGRNAGALTWKFTRK